MAKIFQVTSGGGSAPASTTEFWGIYISGIANVTTETNQQLTYRAAGTFSNLYIRVLTNATSATSTFRTRQNAADGSLVISIGAGTTGEFEDTANTDTITAGDEWNYSFAAGAGGTVTYGSASILFSANANTVCVLAQTNLNFSTASTTRYIGLASNNTSSTLEADGEQEINSAGTLKNLFLNINSNTRTTTTTFKTRKTGVADGNLSISVTGSSTGLFEDTANSDTVAANDLWNYSFTTGTGTGTISWGPFSVNFETTNSKFVSGGGSNLGLAQAAGTTNYLGIGAGNNPSTTETDRTTETNLICSISNFVIYISANATTASSTFEVRKNQGTTACSISISAGTTGLFEDTDSVSYIATDEVNVSFTAGTGGTITRHCWLVLIDVGDAVTFNPQVIIF